MLSAMTAAPLRGFLVQICELTDTLIAMLRSRPADEVTTVVRVRRVRLTGFDTDRHTYLPCW